MLRPSLSRVGGWAGGAAPRRQEWPTGSRSYWLQCLRSFLLEICSLKCFIDAAHISGSFRESVASAIDLRVLDMAVGKGLSIMPDMAMGEITKGCCARSNSVQTDSMMRAGMGLICSTYALIRACSHIRLMTRGIPFE